MSYINFIRRYSEQILLAMTERNKSGQGFICPVCGSGTSEGETGISPGKGKPGIFQCDNPGCRFKKGDILKIIELAYHLQGGDSVKKAGELIGMDFKKEYQAERKRVFQESGDRVALSLRAASAWDGRVCLNKQERRRE